MTDSKDPRALVEEAMVDFAIEMESDDFLRNRTKTVQATMAYILDEGVLEYSPAFKTLMELVEKGLDSPQAVEDEESLPGFCSYCGGGMLKLHNRGLVCDCGAIYVRLEEAEPKPINSETCCYVCGNVTSNWEPVHPVCASNTQNYPPKEADGGEVVATVEIRDVCDDDPCGITVFSEHVIPEGTYHLIRAEEPTDG